MQESLPKTWSLRRPRQKCSAIWNISTGLSKLPTCPMFWFLGDPYMQKIYELHFTNHWFFINNEINVHISVDEVAISGPPHCPLNAHQAMLFCPWKMNDAKSNRRSRTTERIEPSKDRPGVKDTRPRILVICPDPADIFTPVLFHCNNGNITNTSPPPESPVL